MSPVVKAPGLSAVKGRKKSKMLTPERAREVWAQRRAQWNMEGLLTPEEENHVQRVWDYLPGTSSWMDAFLLIRNATPQLHSGLTNGTLIVVKETGHGPFRGRRGVVYSYVPFGKYYVYLTDPKTGEITRQLVDGDDLRLAVFK